MLGPSIAIEAVTRRFGPIVAVSEASLRLEPGAIHAIVGENGAGKSTLLKMAAGMFAPSAGRVLVGGISLEPASPAEAIRRGVGMVHQHFMLVGAFRAIENVVLAVEPRDRLGRLDLARAERDARTLMEKSGLSVRLDAVTDTLTVGERQRLEILRVLFRGARAILLDEPTAVLSPLEADELYGTLQRLAEDGATIAVVTHRLDEVVRFASKVTVMRRGRVVHERSIDDEARRGARGLEDELTRAIMGGDPPPPFSPPAMDADAKPLLEISGLSLASADSVPALDGVDLSVRAGEIVGVAGVEGNGQRELVRAIAGLEPSVRGRIAVGGIELQGPPRARRERIGVVHEDRHVDGLVLDATVADNLVLGDLSDIRSALDEAAIVARRIDRYGVRPADPERLASELSGGNQQKLVVARAIDRLVATKRSGALVLAQPTRGVDVGAAHAIHTAIGDAAARGLAVIIVSADLAELRRVSHRIVVMHRGRIVATLAPDAPDDAIGRAMLGMEAA